MKKIIFIFIVTIIFLTPGCKKDLLNVEDPSEYSFNNYFKNKKQLNEGVIAIYSVLLHPGLYAKDYYFIFDLLGNDAKPAGSLDNYEELAHYSFDPRHDRIQYLWASLYRMILRANVVIDRATVWNPGPGEADFKLQYIAEAKFLRAYAHFMLTTLWGPVPIRRSYQQIIDTLYPHRSPVSEVHEFIRADLMEAITSLPNKDDAELGRATKGAAIALLGKLYLYKKDWANAEAKLTELKNLGQYHLSPYDELFGENNQHDPEVIFQVMHKEWEDGDEEYFEGGQETEGNYATHCARAWEYGFAPDNGQSMNVADALVQAYKYNHPDFGNISDRRLQEFVYANDPANGKDTYCDHCDPPTSRPFTEPGAWWKKYGNYEWIPQYENKASKINSVIIRYSDVLLMLAEAQIEQNKLGLALANINDVRRRTSAAPDPFLYSSLGSQAEARTKLRRERQLELAGEQSRYFDLVRWGILRETLNPELQAQYGTSPVQQKHYLLPIPQQEKNTNPNISIGLQNGWN